MSSNSPITTTALTAYYPEHQFKQIAKKNLQNKCLENFDLETPITLSLPEKPMDLYEKVLFPFQRHIEKLYKELPWPEQMKKILVSTQVEGGRGDIAAAAKAISLMQRICPKTLSFDWVSHHQKDCEPLSFLTPEEASRVTHRGFSSSPLEKDPADFLLIGPVPGSILGNVRREIEGPTYGFNEIAAENPNPLEKNFKLYRCIFPSNSEFSRIPMGIVPGSGIFLDQSRTQAPLSRTYCCPSYIRLIQDISLRKDILESMQVYDDKTTPDFDKYSLNSGYAHLPHSWGSFIDNVAIHEKDKHVIVVLNQKGAGSLGEHNDLSVEEYCDEIFTPQRLDLLQKQGYGSVTLKAEDTEKAFLLTGAQGKRNFTVIIRSSFKPSDMKQLQLASERLLATGDNTAIESWCARCKLYQYELITHKSRFLHQQIDLAKSIAPSLARFLEFRGNTTELEEVLSDPTLATDTLKFCRYITKHCSFDPIFEGGIKRTAWHHIIPKLKTIEEETIDKEFRSGLCDYIDEPKPGKSLTISTLSLLKKRIHDIVEQHIHKGPV